MAERGLPDQTRAFEQNFGASTLHEQHTAEPSLTGNGANIGESITQEKGTAHRGFAAMDSEKQKRIASEGGRAAHRQGVAHEWNRDEAKEAGRKGGQIVSQNREHMSEIGRRGGKNSGQRRQRSEESE